MAGMKDKDGGSAGSSSTRAVVNSSSSRAPPLGDVRSVSLSLKLREFAHLSIVICTSSQTFDAK